jgi:hypothetical protein
MNLKNNTFNLIILLITFTAFKVNAINTNNYLNNQKISDVSSSKLSILLSSIEYKKLLPTPIGIGGKFSEFGKSVSIDGNRAVVGAPGVLNHGVVYVLDLINENWVESSILIPNDVQENDSFGDAVSISGNRILIGSPSSDNNIGSVYIFDLDTISNTWNQSAKLIGEDGEFGFSLSLEGNRAVIGAPYERNDSGIKTGSVYVYNLDIDTNTWLLDTKLFIADGAEDDYFGFSVGVSGNRIIIGMHGDGTGSVFIYEKDEVLNTWIQSNKLIPKTLSVRFGYSVSIDNNTAIIGMNDNIAMGSAYIFEFEEFSGNWIESARLRAEGGVTSDHFGFSVSVKGNRALIGTSTPSINRNGRAYIFDFDSVSELWVQTQEIEANDGSANDYFGRSISLSENRVFIGAYGDEDYGEKSGSSYIFELNNDTWSQTVKSTTGDSSTGDNFGFAVSIYGNRALVGASGDDTNAIQAGAAYIFDLDIISGEWLLTDKLYANDGTDGESFGYSVSLFENRALIGAKYDDAGSAYIFELNISTGLWEQSAKITADDGAWPDRFGHSVSLYGDKAIVGAYNHDDVLSNSGSAYIFDLDKSNNTWIQSAKLNPNVILESGYFGSTVELSDNRALIGGFDVDRNLAGTHNGTAYIFDYDVVSGIWSQTTQLNAINPPQFNQFGKSMSLNEDRVIVGAIRDTATGSAYIFDLDKINGIWSQTAKITLDNPLIHDLAENVGLIGNTAFISFEDYDPNNHLAPQKSKVYTFNLNSTNGNWSLGNTIDPIENALNDQFGSSLSIHKDRVIIGAPSDDDNGSNSGSVYIFINSIFSNGFE